MLNIPRLRAVMTVAVMEGGKFARSRAQLPLYLFDALALSEEEAGHAQTDVNTERAIDEARRG